MLHSRSLPLRTMSFSIVTLHSFQTSDSADLKSLVLYTCKLSTTRHIYLHCISIHVYNTKKFFFPGELVTRNSWPPFFRMGGLCPYDSPMYPRLSFCLVFLCIPRISGVENFMEIFSSSEIGSSHLFSQS